MSPAAPRKRADRPEGPAIPTPMSDQVQPARREIVRCQIRRFHDFYASYFNRADTRPMVEYFFDRIYSLEEDETWRKKALSTKDTTRCFRSGASSSTSFYPKSSEENGNT